MEAVKTHNAVRNKEKIILFLFRRILLFQYRVYLSMCTAIELHWMKMLKLC